MAERRRARPRREYFPQRVLYRLQSEGRLHARIEGTVKGACKGVDFPMKRVSCDAPL
jgi:hypothetical protein